MAQMWTEKRVVISPDAPTLAAAVAERLLSRLARRSAAGKTTHIALAGGQIGTAVLRAAGDSPRRADIDWSLVHIWWGDEVFTTPDDVDRHDSAARAAL